MKNTPDDTDTMQDEYDFSAMNGAVRGKYFEQAQQGTNVVLLDADVAEVFPDSEAVNKALRLLLNVAKKVEHQR